MSIHARFISQFVQIHHLASLNITNTTYSVEMLCLNSSSTIVSVIQVVADVSRSKWLLASPQHELMFVQSPAVGKPFQIPKKNVIKVGSAGGLNVSGESQ
jgi:hypothetical protein